MMEVPMPWQETSVMNERMAFIVDWQRKEASMAELCRRYGVSRKTGYKLLHRFDAEGSEGLDDRSRAPHHHPNAVSAAVEEMVLSVRRAHPTWGPKKIRAWLAARDAATPWPVESTIARILDRHGLVARRRRRGPRVAAAAVALSPCVSANDVWGVDFKGWFRTGDGRRCDPLSLSDLASRYVLRLQALTATGVETVWPILDAAFREFGPPLVMRSDNGPPFASVGAGGLSRLAVRLIQVGVLPEYIAPGKPQQNGRHERLHRTVKEDTAAPPAANVRAQQRRFDRFRRVFNEERPHEALGQTPPAAHYDPPPRRYSGRLRAPDYHADHLVRRVHRHGEIKWRGRLVYIGEALIGEPVGLEEIDDGCWVVRYGPVDLGIIDETRKFARITPGPRPGRDPGEPTLRGE